MQKNANASFFFLSAMVATFIFAWGTMQRKHFIVSLNSFYAALISLSLKKNKGNIMIFCRFWRRTMNWLDFENYWGVNLNEVSRSGPSGSGIFSRKGGGGYPLTIPAQNNTYIIFSKLLKREISMVNISTYLPLYSNQQKPYN